MELLQFVDTTTHFSFRGTIHQQKFGTAMTSPVSPVIANLFMEWLEQTIATAPVTCQPRLWKRYVDDVMKIVKKGCEQPLTAHLNTIDTYKFTYEEESCGSLPFLDTLMVRKVMGRPNSLCIERTHTDQYLKFSSHHPLHQKLGVIKPLLDRCNNIVTDPETDGKKKSTSARLFRSVATLSGV